MREAPGCQLVLRDRRWRMTIPRRTFKLFPYTRFQRSDGDMRLFPGCLVEQTARLGQLDFATRQPSEDTGHLSQDGLQWSDHFFEGTNTMSEGIVGVLLNGPCHVEVQNLHRRRLLANAVDAADTLFDAHRVPGQVIIDQ